MRTPFGSMCAGAACRALVVAASIAVALLGVSFGATGAMAEPVGHELDGAVPGIWVDPDGCQHFVLTDGVEGYMTPNMRPDGTMVCNSPTPPACLVAGSDQLFAVDKSYIAPRNRHRLAEFFRTNGARSYSIAGHTDSNASDAYNMGLSLRRANAVARIARSVGARVTSVRGYGERRPIASNATAAGRAKNRRVEIQCLN